MLKECNVMFLNIAIVRVREVEYHDDCDNFSIGYHMLRISKSVCKVPRVTSPLYHQPSPDKLPEPFNRSLKSSEAHAFLKDIGARTSGKNIKGSVSRASIIFFLNELVDQGIITYDEFSGKGGWGRKYKMILTRERFAHKIIGRFVDKLHSTFPKECTTFKWPRN